MKETWKILANINIRLILIFEWPRIGSSSDFKKQAKQHAAIFVLAPSRYVDNHIKLFYLFWFALLPYLFYLLEFLINFILCKILIKSLFFLPGGLYYPNYLAAWCCL